MGKTKDSIRVVQTIFKTIGEPLSAIQTPWVALTGGLLKGAAEVLGLVIPDEIVDMLQGQINETMVAAAAATREAYQKTPARVELFRNVADWLSVYMVRDVIGSWDQAIEAAIEMQQEHPTDFNLADIKEAVALFRFKFNQHMSKYPELSRFTTNESLQRIEAQVREIHETFDIKLSELPPAQKNFTATKEERDFPNSQKDEFLKKWEGYLFLHMPQNAHHAIMLKEVYLVPDCKRSGRDRNTVDEIDGFLNDNGSHSMIIVGNPGVGKSSLVCFLANKYISDHSLVFIRMSELEPKTAASSILDAVVEFLGCKTRDLKNRTLVLDGYDELRVDNLHYKLCVSFVSEIASIEGLKVIISTRKNYVDLNKESYHTDFQRTITLELLPFGKEKIKAYVAKFNHLVKSLNGVDIKDIDSNKTPVEVFGIPFILYLICSFDMDISSISNLIDVYNRVFAFDGGIFDKIYDNNGHYLLNNPHVKSEIIAISKEIALEMFRINRIELSHDTVSKVLIKYPDRKKDYAIGNYYSIENDRVLFVHKTFFEYFICLYLVDTLYALERGNASPEEVFCLLDTVFYSDNYLYKRLEEMLRIMISSKIHLFESGAIKKSADHILSNLLFFHKQGDAQTEYSRVQNLISSTLKIYNLLLGTAWMKQLTSRSKKDLLLLLRLKNYVRVELSGVELENEDMSALFMRAPNRNCSFRLCNLNRVDARGAYMNNCLFFRCEIKTIHARKAAFEDCEFHYTTFSQSDLTEASFLRCKFTNVDFNHANLYGASFVDCEINGRAANACLAGATFRRTMLEIRGNTPREFTSFMVFDPQTVQTLLDDPLCTFELVDATVDLYSQQNSKYCSVRNNKDPIDLAEYRGAFFAYNDILRILQERGKPVPVEIFLFSGEYECDPDIFFDGMHCDLISAKLDETTNMVTISVSIKYSLQLNRKALKRGNLPQQKTLISAWENMRLDDNGCYSFIATALGKENILACLRVI